jgi:Zn finger protein HypA/HybF involved in hydrogenase expression
MHEAKVAQYALEIINETLKGCPKDKKVVRVNFAIGRPHTVMRDSFEFYFCELIKGSAIEDAELLYEYVEEDGFFVASIEIED